AGSSGVKQLDRTRIAVHARRSWTGAQLTSRRYAAAQRESFRHAMSTNEEDVSSISRREAASGRVSYGDPVILHDTTRTRIQLVPFYVPRSEGTDLSVKIVTYKKSPPPNDWVVLEEKSLSLNEAASRALLHALRTHLAVADQDEDGDYIVIRTR